MHTRTVTLIVSLLTVIVSSLPSYSQSRIDRLVTSFEKDPNVQVTYTERRDPQTKKLVKQSTILNGYSEKQGSQLWDAFEQERVNSVSVTKTPNQSFIIKFEDKDFNSSYVLSVQQGGVWSLVISKRSVKYNDDSSFNSLDFSGKSFNDFDFSTNSADMTAAFAEMEANFADFDAHFADFDSKFSEFEINLKELESLKNLKNGDFTSLSGNVTVYDSNGNIIYQSNSSTNSSAGKLSKKAAKEATSNSSKKANRPKESSKSSHKTTTSTVVSI